MEGKAQNTDKSADNKHSEQVDVVAVIKVKPDRIEAFRPVLEKLIDGTRKE
jgi:hypothetical protein